MTNSSESGKGGPGYLLASHLRDMAKLSYSPPPDHVNRLYQAARIVEAHAQLVALLDRAVDTFDRSQSVYIPGCGEDTKFDRARDSWLVEARAALAAAGVQS